MPLQMIDRHQGFPRRVRQRLCRYEAHHHPTDEPRPRCRRNRVDIGERQFCVRQRPLYQRDQCLDMRARRNFGNDPAKRAMRRFLSGQPMRQHLPVARDQRCCGFIAA